MTGRAQSHAAREFCGRGVVADQGQLRLRLRLRQDAHVEAFREALRHDSNLRLVVRGVLRVHRQPPVVPPAAVATVTVAVHARLPVTAHEQRGSRRARGTAAGPGAFCNSVRRRPPTLY